MPRRRTENSGQTPSTRAPRWSDGLIGSARRIAEAEHSPLRVLAGPGTGKTFALMRRVMRLLEEGAEARRVLVATFTRTAARDLQDELGRLGVEGASDVRAGTIHAFCFSILSKAEVLEATGRVPRPLLRFEERFLLEDLHLVVGEGIRALKNLLNAFAAAWARLQSEQPGWPRRQDQPFHTALDAWLRFHEAMLIHELVPETLRFLRNNPESPHRPALDHVLVDEYQDLNRAEQVLHDELASGGSLVVVGDEDQSIYSFKYAHPEGIASFDDGHPGTRDESLADCRRCPRRVVALANSLIAHNTHRTPRKLTPLPGSPEGEVLVVQWSSMESEAAGLARFIAGRIESGAVEAGRILVLAPRRQLGYAIRDALTECDVPAHSFFSEEALDGDPKDADDCAAQEAFSLLALLANRYDRVALRCWCGFGTGSLRARAWARLRAHCEESGDTPWDALKQLDTGTLTLPHSAQIVERFRALRARRGELRGLTGVELVDALFPTDEQWAEPIRAVIGEVDADCDAKDLLELARRSVTQPELPTDVDYVRVMSLHKSKGLTADLVVVVGCMEGVIPSLPERAAPAEIARALEEQRRLFYVAITRTRGTLVLSSVTRLPLAEAYRMRAVIGNRGKSAALVASRFLDELGPSCPAAVRGNSILPDGS